MPAMPTRLHTVLSGRLQNVTELLVTACAHSRLRPRGDMCREPGALLPPLWLVEVVGDVGER